MLEQYYFLMFGYFLVGLIVSLHAFVMLNTNLNLLVNRKLRNEKVFVRANIAIHKRNLQLSALWPYLLLKMSLDTWRLMSQTTQAPKKVEVKNSSANLPEPVNPPRVKPKQMTRRNRRE